MWPRKPSETTAENGGDTNLQASRGQSLQLGAVLLFGFLVLGLATAQAQVVPAEISQAEADHSQTVADEQRDLTTAILQTSVDGQPQPTTVSLGAEYPNRLWAVYPPPGSGTLSTTASQALTIENAEATAESQSFDNYWQGDVRQYTTRAVSFEPTYRELDAAPAHRIEHGIAATKYETGTELQVAAGRQPVVDGEEISLIVVAGELEQSGVGSEAVVAERVSSATTVTVEASGEPITLTLPTTLPASAWQELLEDEPNVESLAVDDEHATITLDSSTQYALTLHRVEIGETSSQPTATYLRNTSDGVVPKTPFNSPTAATVWAYNKGSYDSPAAEFTAPTESQPAVGSEVCYTLVAGETDGDKPATVGSPAGSCE